MFDLFTTTISTFVLSVFFIAVLRRVTGMLALVDLPDARKRHQGAIPLCGGMAVFSAFAVVSFASGHVHALGMNFWASLLVLVTLGVIDDRHSLSAVARLFVQLGVAVVLVAGIDIGAMSVGAMVADPAAQFLPFFFLIGVFFIAGLVNSWNMLDGVDGLAGGAAAVALIWLMFVAGLQGPSELIVSLEMLLVGICAFLVFNMRSPWRIRASVFLGDAGSTALGATIAYTILVLSTQDAGASLPALLWIVIIPVTDTLSLIVRRMLAHRSPMSADRWHLHHLLLDHGLTPAETTLVLMAASAVCGGLGYAGIRAGVPGELMAAGLVVPVSIHTAFVMAATGVFARLRLDHARARGVSMAPVQSFMKEE